MISMRESTQAIIDSKLKYKLFISLEAIKLPLIWTNGYFYDYINVTHTFILIK